MKQKGASLKIKIGSISDDGFLESFDYKFSNYQFSYDDRINDFIKLNEERLIYVGKNKADNSEFIIFLFDLYNDLKNMKIRVFKFKDKMNLDHYCF